MSAGPKSQVQRRRDGPALGYWEAQEVCRQGSWLQTWRGPEPRRLPRAEQREVLWEIWETPQEIQVRPGVVWASVVTILREHNKWNEFHLLRFTPPLCCVLTGRLKRSVIALHPRPPPRPLLPPTLHLSEVKTTWERGWSTRRRATVTPVFLHGTTAGPQTEVLGSMRATTRREAEAVDL